MHNKTFLLHASLLLLFAALIGALYPLVKIAEETIPPLTLTLLRALFAVLFLLPVVGLLMKRNLKSLHREWKNYAILGLMLSVVFISISEAEEYISAGLSAVLACVLPISTFLLTTLVLRWERFSLMRLAGALVALFGVSLFIGLHELLGGGSEWIGVCAIAGGFFVYSVYMIFFKTRELDPFLAATGTMIFVAIFMSIAAFALEQPLQIEPSRNSMLAALFVGIFATGLGYVILYYLVANAGPVFASTFGYFAPIFAILASHFLISEPLSWGQLGGVAITLTGAWLVNRRPKKPEATGA